MNQTLEKTGFNVLKVQTEEDIQYDISLEKRRHPPSSSIETPFPCLYNCTVGVLAVIQTDSYCNIQLTEKLYRQGTGVSIYDDGGGGGALYSIRIYILCWRDIQTGHLVTLEVPL